MTDELPFAESQKSSSDSYQRIAFWFLLLLSALGLVWSGFSISRHLAYKRAVIDSSRASLMSLTFKATESIDAILREVMDNANSVASAMSEGKLTKDPALDRLRRALIDEGSTEEARQLRKRVVRGIPRKVRKELERFTVADLPTLLESSDAWFTEEQRWNDRLASLLAHTASGTLSALGHQAGGPPIPRVVDLVRWVSSDACLRALLRLQNG